MSPSQTLISTVNDPFVAIARVVQSTGLSDDPMGCEAEANARLIASAPELLESEMKFVQLCNDLAVALTDDQIAKAVCALTAHSHDARAAIAKATGN